MSERLAFILSLDASGAIRGFQKVGDAADKELGRADNRLDKLGSNMTKFGAGAVAASGVAAVGLFKFAQASQEAQLSELKLQNTLANMPKLAGATADEFVELAEAIQKKTAADADQIVEAQAMLGTFSTTADEIKGLTPLVVDFSRKFGVDLTTAAIQVGKAMDGQIGALKRNGVSIDENLYKTDRYAAVTQALRDQVGGFAEAEGATFAGRLESLKNQLGDIQEGVGVGVVEAFSDMSGIVFGAADAVGALNEQTLAGAGQFATYATAAVGVVGSLSFVGGQAIKLRERFMTVHTEGDTTTRTMNKLGKASAGLGAILVAGGVIAAAYELGESFDSSAKFAEEFAGGTSDLAVALRRLDQIVDDNTQASETWSSAWTDGGKAAEAAQLEAKNLSEAQEDLTNILETGNIVAAQRYVEAMGQAGLSTEEATKQIEAATGAAQQHKVDMEQTAEIIDGDVAPAYEAAETKVRDFSDAMNAANTEIAEQLGQAFTLEEAVSNWEAAYDDLAEALKENGTTLDLSTEKGRANRDALREIVTASGDVVQAAIDRGASSEDVQAIIENEKTKLYELAVQFGLPKAAVEEYTEKLDQIPKIVRTTLEVTELMNRAPSAAGLGSYGRRASGGPVAAGGTYLVGEEGPELLQMGASGGNVVPNHALGGSATFNFNFSGPVGNERQMQEWVMSALEAAKRSGYSIPVSG